MDPKIFTKSVPIGNPAPNKRVTPKIDAYLIEAPKAPPIPIKRNFI